MDLYYWPNTDYVWCVFPDWWCKQSDLLLKKSMQIAQLTFQVSQHPYFGIDWICTRQNLKICLVIFHTDIMSDEGRQLWIMISSHLVRRTLMYHCPGFSKWGLKGDKLTGQWIWHKFLCQVSNPLAALFVACVFHRWVMETIHIRPAHSKLTDVLIYLGKSLQCFTF